MLIEGITLLFVSCSIFDNYLCSHSCTYSIFGTWQWIRIFMFHCTCICYSTTCLAKCAILALLLTWNMSICPLIVVVLFVGIGHARSPDFVYIKLQNYTHHNTLQVMIVTWPYLNIAAKHYNCYVYFDKRHSPSNLCEVGSQTVSRGSYHYMVSCSGPTKILGKLCPNKDMCIESYTGLCRDGTDTPLALTNKNGSQLHPCEPFYIIYVYMCSVQHATLVHQLASLYNAFL